MARKRRGRASASVIPTPESATNSLATSSPSSHRNSRSDDNESDLGTGGGSGGGSGAASGGGGGGGTRAKRLSSDPLTSPDVDIAHLPTHSLHPHVHSLPHLSATAHAQNPSSAHSLRGSYASPSAPTGLGASPGSSATAAASLAPVQDAGAVVVAASAAAAESVATGDPTHFNVASVALRLYEQLIDWAVLQFAVQYKHHVYLTSEERRRAGAFPSTGQRSSSRISIVHGSCGSSLLFSEKSVTVDCSHCGTSTAASRYALHVEKCLGLGGRMSSRTASQRLRSAAERADKDSAADMDDVPTRRRRHSSAASAADQDSGPVLASHVSHKRRKMSPLTSGGSASVGHGSLNSRGLPPSGRTRASPK